MAEAEARDIKDNWTGKACSWAGRGGEAAINAHLGGDARSRQTERDVIVSLRGVEPKRGQIARRIDLRIASTDAAPPHSP